MKFESNMTLTPGDETRLHRIADELEGAGWPYAAKQVLDGVPLETIIGGLDSTVDAEAIEIITWTPE